LGSWEFDREVGLLIVVLPVLFLAAVLGVYMEIEEYEEEEPFR